MRIRNAIFCASIILSTNSANSIEFRAVAESGLDSNPLELSDGLSVIEEEYLKASFDSESDLADLFYWDVSVAKAHYFSDTRVDWFDADAKFKLASDYSILEVPFGYEVGGNYRSHDETYVARETGLVASFNGTSLADRYDVEEIGYHVGLSYPMSSDSEIWVKYANQENQFESFELVDLDNLDNTEKSSSLGVKFYPQEKGHFYLELTQRLREYDDRRDRALDATFIADSNLEFNHYQTDIGYVYEPGDGSRWEYGFRYTNRTTNGTHFYDAQSGLLRIKVNYRLADYHILNTEFNIRTFFYDESLAQPFALLDPEDVEREGVELKLEYTWVLATLFSTNLGFYAAVHAKQYESPDDFYDYQRYQASLGIRWALD